jgi:molybdate transport system substrate-binding protein
VLRSLALVVLAAALSVPAAAARSPVTVFAAASLTDVFPRIDPAARYSFAGSNALAAQIQLGAPADVFASANTTLPQQLYRQGLVDKPVVFTRNALVLIVPRSNPAGIHGVYDLKRAGIELVQAKLTAAGFLPRAKAR